MNQLRPFASVVAKVAWSTKEFPGAGGFGLIRRVPRQDETRFLQRTHADGRPDFTVHQFAPHDGERYIIEYLEPAEQNAAAIGLDVASESVRREAAENAMLTGQTTMTGPITLVQDTGARQQAFLLLMPIYREGRAPSTAADRDASVFGWSFAPLFSSGQAQTRAPKLR